MKQFKNVSMMLMLAICLLLVGCKQNDDTAKGENAAQSSGQLQEASSSQDGAASDAMVDLGDISQQPPSENPDDSVSNTDEKKPQPPHNSQQNGNSNNTSAKPQAPDTKPLPEPAPQPDQSQGNDDGPLPSFDGGESSTGSEDQPLPEFTLTGDVTLEEFCVAITESYGMQMGMDSNLSDDLAKGIYPGLEEIVCTEKALHVSMITLVTKELSLVRVENKADAEKVKEIFETRVKLQADGGAWYPGAVAAWQNDAQVVVRGNVVMLVVHPEKAKIVSHFNDLF